MHLYYIIPEPVCKYQKADSTRFRNHPAVVYDRNAVVFAMAKRAPYIGNHEDTHSDHGRHN